MSGALRPKVLLLIGGDEHRGLQFHSCRCDGTTCSSRSRGSLRGSEDTVTWEKAPIKATGVQEWHQCFLFLSDPSSPPHCQRDLISAQHFTS